MPFESNSFDGALCIEVLEHALSPELLLAETNRILKPGSRLLLTVPWSARRHHIPHDYHRFTRERLEILLVNSGFDSIQIRERGDDYSVIANKLIVVIIRNLKRISIRNLSHPITPPCFTHTAVCPCTLCCTFVFHLRKRTK